MARVLSIVLAGGEGKRLMPLTVDRAKPAVPFRGSYRLIDFALSNLVNAGVTSIGVRGREAWQLGVIKTGDDGVTIEDFLEKPAEPPGLVDSPDETFASMGNYVFSADVLVDALERDAANPESRH